MKNKKLFAILTLVCFMMTLMPVAAFADDTRYVGVDGDDSVTVNVDEDITVKVFDDEDTASTTHYYFWAENAKGEVVELTEETSVSQATIDFDAVGTYYVYAVESDDVTLNANSTRAALVTWLKDRHESKIIADCLTVKVKQGSVNYTLTADDDDISIVADNGWTNDGKVTLSLKKTSDNTPVRGEEITFTTNSAYVTVKVVDEVTDRNGKAVIKIAASKAGTYKVYAKHANAEREEITVRVSSTGVATIQTVAEPTRTVALDTSFDFYGNPYTGVAFALTSADNSVIRSIDTLLGDLVNDTELTDNLVAIEDEDSDEDKASKEAANTATKEAYAAGKVYKISVLDAPEDSDIDASNLRLSYDGTTNNAWVLKGTETFDVEGTYKFKVTLKNGTSATASVKVLEFDEPVAMNLTYKSPAVAYGDFADVYALVFIDANGTMLTRAHVDYATYGAGVVYTASGKAVANVYDAADTVDGRDVFAGTVRVMNDDDFIGSTITVMAICDAEELTTTAKLVVGDKANGLVYQNKTADIAKNNTLVVKTVDEAGNVVGAVDATSVVNVYVLEAPENAAYAVSGAVKAGSENTINVSFTASAAGEYKLQTVVVTGTAYLSTVDTITVGGVVDNSVKSVIVLSIGSNNIINNGKVGALLAAPEIKDGRTMIPMRAGLEAFGAKVDWNEANQSITAEMDGTTVVMTLGSKTYTVNGKVMTADAAPYLNEAAATTMVPAVFFTNAFGIVATPLYDANGVCDVLFSK